MRECINWVEQRKEEAEKAVEEGEDSEEGEEGSEEGEGGIEEGEGARQDGEEGDVDEELMPTKRLRSARNLRLPDPNRVWKFLKREEKWRYFGKGWQVVPPDGSSPPMDEVHVRTCEASVRRYGATLRRSFSGYFRPCSGMTMT